MWMLDCIVDVKPVAQDMCVCLPPENSAPGPQTVAVTDNGCARRSSSAMGALSPV